MVAYLYYPKYLYCTFKKFMWNLNVIFVCIFVYLKLKKLIHKNFMEPTVNFILFVIVNRCILYKSIICNIFLFYFLISSFHICIEYFLYMIVWMYVYVFFFLTIIYDISSINLKNCLILSIWIQKCVCDR